jgi:hypothetical protein
MQVRPTIFQRNENRGDTMTKELSVRIDTPPELSMKDVLTQVQKIQDVMRQATFCGPVKDDGKIPELGYRPLALVGLGIRRSGSRGSWTFGRILSLPITSRANS